MFEDLGKPKIQLRSSAICWFCFREAHDLCYREVGSNEYDPKDLCGCVNEYHE